MLTDPRRHPKPALQQGVGNGLDADAFLPLAQRNAVAAVISAALVYQPPQLAMLVVIQDGDGFRLLWGGPVPSLAPQFVHQVVVLNAHVAVIGVRIDVIPTVGALIERQSAAWA